jgi:hypothetical protein
LESDICRRRHLKFPPHGFPHFYDTLRIQIMEVKMAAKEIRMGKWLTYGRMSGFGIGFSINRYFVDVQLGFWYVGFEY